MANVYFYNQTFNAAFFHTNLFAAFCQFPVFILFTVNTSQLCIERICTANGYNFDVTWKLF